MIFQSELDLEIGLTNYSELMWYCDSPFLLNYICWSWRVTLTSQDWTKFILIKYPKSVKWIYESSNYVSEFHLYLLTLKLCIYGYFVNSKQIHYDTCMSFSDNFPYTIVVFRVRFNITILERSRKKLDFVFLYYSYT